MSYFLPRSKGQSLASNGKATSRDTASENLLSPIANQGILDWLNSKDWEAMDQELSAVFTATKFKDSKTKANSNEKNGLWTKEMKEFWEYLREDEKIAAPSNMDEFLLAMKLE
jgi:hypothetical protein